VERDRAVSDALARAHPLPFVGWRSFAAMAKFVLVVDSRSLIVILDDANSRGTVPVR